ncbi:glycosyl hydrolase family 28 protein [Paenibacillus harenae]|uniref:glycosyl hydrolase family 28 protein n=1 Tax=Paenibacillus harenae TaxID=306543 RepID=UPI00042074B3|nr:glycosyl hydrolase family 28 protein [Paenibacillus harenae]
MNQLIVYEQPDLAIGNDDFTVNVRMPGGEWLPLFVFEAKVDMHHVRSASMAYFDMEGTVEVRVVSNKQPIREAVIRPLSAGIAFQSEDGDTISFTLDRPCKLSIEVNGERFSNLHLFAGPIEDNPPGADDSDVFLVNPGSHRSEELAAALKGLADSKTGPGSTLYFAPGIHRLEDNILLIPSGTTVYVAGGAVIIGSLICKHAENIVIRGRGILYMSDFEKSTYLRGVQVTFSKNIEIEGLILLDPPHYSIYLGQSEHIRVRNFKSFSIRGWCDGIDMMSSSDVQIKDVFLRTSDDCIAIYGSRGDYYGDSRNITVTDSVFWADVAHAMHIGIHGDHQKDGDIVENIRFDNIDVLEHHEPQENYWGVMAVCAGDNNTVRNVTFNDIRVEDFELGQLVDVRVVWNEKYNPVPGRRIENIVFSNIDYNGANQNPSRIYGYDRERVVDGVTFVNVKVNGTPVTDAANGNILYNEFVSNVRFEE